MYRNNKKNINNARKNEIYENKKEIYSIKEINRNEGITRRRRKEM